MSLEETDSQVEVGWYPEPGNAAKERLWDGQAWTDWTRRSSERHDESDPAAWKPHPSNPGIEVLWSGIEWTELTRPSESGNGAQVASEPRIEGDAAQELAPETAVEASTGEEADRTEIEPNLGGIALALVAAVLAIVAVFLPALETTDFPSIAENTLIQSGTGWIILGCAVGIIGAVYRAYSKRTEDYAIFILGLVILGSAVYSGTGDRTKLESVGSIAGEKLTADGSPDIGLYAAGAAGVMAMIAGLVLAGVALSSFQGAERKTKTCPDCAETVLAAARVCKHCGHEFAETEQSPPEASDSQ